MGECSECKVWFHKECVKTSFSDNWLCWQRAYKARQDAAQVEWTRKEFDTMLENSDYGLCQPSIYEHGHNVLISCNKLLEEQTAVTVEREQHEKVLEVLISCIVTASK